MTLLREIQEDAVSDETSVSSLLRKCLLLAGRLHNEQLRAWAQQELDGYDDEADLPPYRPRLETQVRGTLSGPMQSHIRGQALARGSVPEDWRDDLFSVEIRMGVATIEGFCDGDAKEVYSPWPMDVVAHTQSDYILGYNLMSAQRVIPIAALRGVLDGIRSRVVQFATEIEREDPEAGEQVGAEQITQERLTQIVMNNFYGDNAAAATGGRDVSQGQTVVNTELKLVEATLEGLGIGEKDLHELIAALSEEGMPRGAPGPKTQRWLDRLQQGAISVGSGVGAAAATDVILKILGLA